MLAHCVPLEAPFGRSRFKCSQEGRWFQRHPIVAARQAWCREAYQVLAE